MAKTQQIAWRRQQALKMIARAASTDPDMIGYYRGQLEENPDDRYARGYVDAMENIAHLLTLWKVDK